VAVPANGSGTPDLATPRSPRRPAAWRGKAERYGWLFLRLSGLALIVLVLGHLLVVAILDGGVHRINFASVAGRWSSPLWRLWDLVTLWLAEIHGTIGLRTVIDDYARRNGTRLSLKVLLYTSAVLILALGTYVIVTFDPNISAN
jgi:succinate dehydrogenase / fumarate reductase membrane anchor subunit